jgi:tetratricopeptide (TPR) repeat protein
VTAVVKVWLRYCLLLAARALGALRRAILSSWRLPVVALACTWLVLAVLHDHRNGPPATPFNVVALFVLLALGRWLWVARKRLVIGNFVDYRGDKPNPLPGLSTLLQVELARLYDLLQVVDDQRAVPEAVRGRQNPSFDEERELKETESDRDLVNDRPLDVPAAIQVEDLTDVLDAAVSIEATITFGPIQVPIGALANLLGRLARGPRLNGSIHLGEGGLVVTARTVGDKRARAWRVDARPMSVGAATQERPDDLVEELAVRIFTDLALKGLVKWKATSAYLDGLRAYRACLGTQKDRRLNLERAKDCFIETIAADDKFALAHYNLGVVTTELAQTDAAEAAFLAAIRLDKRRWAPYYGLAQLYVAHERYPEVVTLCGRIVRLRRHRAEAYHLRALSNRRNNDVAAARHDRRAALRWAWIRLCGAALSGREDDARQLAATSLRNLAVLRAYAAKDRVTRRSRCNKPRAPDDDEDREKRPLRLRIGYFAAACELRQGKFLNPSDAELRFELGKIYAARRRWRAAARQLERAVEIWPDRPRFWIQLARAYAGPRSGRRVPALRERARFATDQARAHPSLIVEDGFKRLERIYTRLQKCDDASRLAELREFAAKRKQWEREAPTRETLEELLLQLKDERYWEVTHVCLQLQEYRMQLDMKYVSQVADRLVSQLPLLCKGNRGEVKEHDVYAQAAEWLHAADRDLEALHYAETAVVHDPLSTRARKILAMLHLSLGHFDQAEEAWRAALVCDPDGCETNIRLGECLVRAALESHEPGRRRELFEEATNHLRTALKLYELQVPRDGNGVGRCAEDIGLAGRFWLGRALFELDKWEQAVTQYQFFVTLKYEPLLLLARLRLGVAYLRMGHMCEGEQALKTVLAEGGACDGGTIVGLPGDPVSVRDIRAWARVHLAGSQIDRDAGVQDAVKTIRQVRAEADRRRDDPEATGLLAACADWEGWALFQMDKVKRALDRLRESVRLEPTPEAYAHLAQVYADLALKATAPLARQRDEARARHYATLARRMVLASDHARPLDAVMHLLEASAR